MLPMKRSVWLLLGTAALMVGCASTGTNLRSSAERLERRAEDLTREVRVAEGRGDYRRDAEAFAEEARDFRRVVEDRDSDKRDVRAAFRDLSERYHALRDEADERSDPATKADFRKVTEAYLDVEREMGGERYANERY
jgi:hypothetical protein